MATITQLRDRIKRRLARSSSTAVNSIILDEMTHVQVEILEAEAFLPSFLAASFSFAVSGSHSSISLLETVAPNIPRFIRPINDTKEQKALKYLADGYYHPVPRFDSFEQLKQLHGDGADRGDFPLGYYWNGNPAGALQVRPQTNGSISYQFDYYQHDPNTASSPDAGDMCLWSRFAADVLMHRTGLEVATNLRDADAVGYFGSNLTMAMKRLRDKKTAEEMADLDLAMGD